MLEPDDIDDQVDDQFEIDLFTPEEEADPIVCPDCGSVENYHGYGFAAGGLGGYTMCLECGKTLEYSPDPDAEAPAGQTA